MSKQFRRSDATKLDASHINQIMGLRYKIPNAAMVAAKIYGISASRVYQIWKSGTELDQHVGAPDRVVGHAEATKIIKLNATLFSIRDTQKNISKLGKSEENEHHEHREHREHQSSSSTRHDKNRSSSPQKKSVDEVAREEMASSLKIREKVKKLISE